MSALPGARPTLKSRKPVRDLTVLDLMTFPVWEYALEEQGLSDETWVRPTERERLGRGLYSQLVRSRFWTARAQPLLGIMTVSTSDAKPDVAVGAILEPSYLPLPHLSRPEALRRRATWDIRIRQDLLRGLGRRESTTFPLRYELAVPIGRGSTLITGSLR